MRSRVIFACMLLCACAKAPPPSATKDPSPIPATAPEKGSLALGAKIAPGAQTVALADVAKDPASFKGKTITTTGTVTSVCQQMGCWMEIKDEASQAHIKMAGHDFFVPKTAAGRKAKVQATLVPSDDENADCNKEAANQMGKAIAKLQLEATGVELD